MLRLRGDLAVGHKTGSGSAIARQPRRSLTETKGAGSFTRPNQMNLTPFPHRDQHERSADLRIEERYDCPAQAGTCRWNRGSTDFSLTSVGNGQRKDKHMPFGVAGKRKCGPGPKGQNEDTMPTFLADTEVNLPRFWTTTPVLSKSGARGMSSTAAKIFLTPSP